MNIAKHIVYVLGKCSVECNAALLLSHQMRAALSLVLVVLMLCVSPLHSVPTPDLSVATNSEFNLHMHSFIAYF